MSPARYVVLLVVIAVTMFCAGAVIADDAAAHVRDRDKVALCNGDGSQRRHFHDGGIKFGYYYYIQFDYWSGIYIHYDVWKYSYTGIVYDRENKVVNCQNY